MNLQNRFDRLLKAMAFGEAPKIKSDEDTDGNLSKTRKPTSPNKD